MCEPLSDARLAEIRQLSDLFESDERETPEQTVASRMLYAARLASGVPALLAEVERLRAFLAELVEAGEMAEPLRETARALLTGGDA